MFNVVDTGHTQKYFDQVATIANKIDKKAIEEIVSSLARLRETKGRLFILGVGGSAANASHAVNDFRKLCEIETYAPTDNVSELTARTNDEGWETVFEGWLRVSQLSDNDAVLVFSVGGGNVEKNVSVNIIKALDLAVARGASILGVVGRDGGAVAALAHHFVIVPTIDDTLITPHTEAFQAVVWHCLVSHPLLQRMTTKW
jgi:D-sedoheptulose 7-phosphate isomerase